MLPGLFNFQPSAPFVEEPAAMRNFAIFGWALLAVALLPHSVEAGLKAYWSFDNTLNEATGNVTTPAFVEPGATAFAAGNVPTVGGSHSLNLLASGQRFRVPLQPVVDFNRSNSFTVSMWINPDSSGTAASTAGARIFDTRGTGAGGTQAGMQFKIIENIGGNQWTIDNATNWQFDNGSGTLVTGSGIGANFPDNTWHHLALAFDAVTQDAQYFVNGTPSGVIDLSAFTGDFAVLKDLSIGGEAYSNGSSLAGNSTQFFTGHLDELAIFDERLTNTQILQLASGTLQPSDFLPAPLTPEPMSLILWAAVAAGAVLLHLRRRTAGT